MDLSIVIVNWNSSEYTIPCIASIRAHTRNLEFEIVVVDNASLDDSCQVLEEYCPSITLVRTSQNIGFGAANNLGYLHSSGRIILFLNPDTEVRDPAVNLMYACLTTSPDIGVLGCRLLNTDLSLQTSCIQPFPTILNQVADFERLRRLWPGLKLWGMRPLFDPDQRTPVAVEAVSGACQMVRREVFEEVGLFSSDYFMYMEDLDLCYKARESGWKVCYLGSATLVHHGGQSSSKRGGESFSGPMMRESVLRFLSKTRGSFYARLYRLSMFLVSVLRVAVLAALMPFSAIRRDKDSLRQSANKWLTIARWSMGLETWTRHRGRTAADCCSTMK